MTRYRTFLTALMFATMASAIGGNAFAEPQKMQTMTTVGSPKPVLLAQANQANSTMQPGAAGGTANLAPAGANTTRVAASQPVGQGTQFLVAQEVAGRVLVAPINADPFGGAAAGWKRLRVGDRLGTGQKIRTCVPGGRVKLVFEPAEPPTVMAIESGSVLAIEELALNNGVSRARLALGVGAVKAGVAESGDTRSDMEITTPTGTLSKKGTDIFRVEYQNGRFRMSLSQNGRGLIQATQLKWGNQGKLIGSRSRFVTRGQFVTQEMFHAIDHVRFDRNININDQFGQTSNEVLTWLNNRGFAFLLPGTNTVNFLGSPEQQPTDGMTPTGGVSTVGIGMARPRREGDFGVGQTILPGGLFNGRVGRKIVRTRQTNCNSDNHRQCRSTMRVVKRRK